MMRFVVGIDGSETASVAAARAGELAARTGGSVHVVCAYSRSEGATYQVGSDSFTVSNMTTAEQIAEQQTAAYRSQGIHSTSVAVDAKPARALLEEAERTDADVIVVGNRRMQGMARVLGAVASEVAHHAPCDVLIVKTT